MIADWTAPATLTTPVGTLTFNAASGDRYLLVSEKCSTNLPVRVSQDDDVPQAHGRIHHRRWWSGFESHLAVELWDGEDPACGSKLVEMADAIERHINALMRPFAVGQGPRFTITQPGTAARMMLDARLASGRTWDAMQGAVEFDLDCDRPYMIDAAETLTEIAAGSTVVIDNPGTVDYDIVLKAHGAASFFTITNTSVTDEFGVPLSIVYDDSLPGAVAIGAGDYVEVDFFRNVMYLNGDGAGRKAGLDILQSDFFPIVPGGNEIVVSGADITVLSHGAWT